MTRHDPNALYADAMRTNSHRTAVLKPLSPDVFGPRGTDGRWFDARIVLTPGDAVQQYIEPWQVYRGSEDFALQQLARKRLETAKTLVVALWIILLLGSVMASLLLRLNPGIVFGSVVLSIAAVVLAFWRIQLRTLELFRTLKERAGSIAEPCLVIRAAPIERLLEDRTHAALLFLEEITPAVRDGLFELANRDRPAVDEALLELARRHERRMQREESRRASALAAQRRSMIDHAIGPEDLGPAPEPLTRKPTMTDAQTSTEHSITLNFEDADTLRQALEYLGDSDAPVMLTSGTVTSAGKAFDLWDGYDQALDDLEH